MKKIILDCDNTLGLPFKEIDDGLTLLYLLGRPDIDIIGVTATFGNGSMQQSYSQTRELLRSYGREDIPVYYGAAAPGDISTDAATFLVEASAKHPGEISLLATGPLTNLLAAWKLAPDFFDNLKQIACMGGYLEPLRIGWRNVAELNFSADAEASWRVFHASCPVTVMSAQLCLQAEFSWRDLSRVKFLDKKMRITIRNWLIAMGLYFGVGMFFLWDLLPVVYINHPELFENREVKITSTVEDLNQGSLVVESASSDQRRINLPSKIKDVEKFRTIIFDSWHQAIMLKQSHGGKNNDWRLQR